MFYKYIYLLEHIRVLAHDDAKCPIRDRKRLGFFSTRKGAMEAISLLAMRQGFSEYPNDFVMKRIKLNTKNLKSYNKKNLTIYSVEHEYYKACEDCDIVTQCGFFCDLAVAESFVKKLTTKRQFYNYPDGFHIGELALDSISELWSEGFEITT